MVEHTLDDRFDYSAFSPEKAEMLQGIAARARQLWHNRRRAKAEIQTLKRQVYMLRTRQHLSKPASKQKHVYFFASNGLIKIGVARNVADRLTHLRPNCSADVECIGIIAHGGHVAEKQLHRQFRHLHMHHEWFQDTPELRAHISSIATTQGSEVSL